MAALTILNKIMFKRDKIYDSELLQSVIRKYCAYQERCHSEVRNRLISMGASSNLIDDIISNLIQENYLSEERFSRAFVRGKFLIKGWGRIKIQKALILKKVSSNCLKIGLLEIDESEYRNKLRKLILKRFSSNKTFSDDVASYRYLQMRGFEYDLIKELIHENVDKPSNRD